MVYPVTHETFANESTTTFTDPIKQNAIYRLLEAIQIKVGLDGDAESIAGSHTAQIKYLIDNSSIIYQNVNAPTTPTTDDLWIDTDNSNLLQRYSTGAFSPISANAMYISGKALNSTLPTDGQVPVYNAASNTIVWEDQTGTGGGGTGDMMNPLVSRGDIIYSADNIGTPDNLPIGNEGDLLSVNAGLPKWIASSVYMAKPAGSTIGDLFTIDAAGALIRMPTGASSQFLKSQGIGQPVIWSDLPSTAPGDDIPLPAGVAHGDLLYADGTSTFVLLHAGTNGQFLKTQGTGAPPVWATIAAGGGMSNPMTTPGDTIYATTGGNPARLPIGTNGQINQISAGIPSWQNPTWITDVFTTSQDLVKRGVSAPERIPVGTNGQILGVSAGVVQWVNAPSGTVPTGSNGDVAQWLSGAFTWAPFAGAHIIQDPSGIDQTARAKLQFAGVAVVTDDSTNNRTVVTVGGGGGGGSGAIWSGIVAPPSVSTLTWINEGNAVATDQSTGFIITYVAASGTDGTNLHAKVAAKPGSGTYTFELGFIPFLRNLNYVRQGMVLQNSTSGKLTMFYAEQWPFDGDKFGIRLHEYNSPTNQFGAVNSVSGNAYEHIQHGGMVFLRVVDNPGASTLSFYWSMDRENWLLFVTRTYTDWINPTHIGAGIESEGATTTRNIIFPVKHWSVV